MLNRVRREIAGLEAEEQKLDSLLKTMPGGGPDPTPSDPGNGSGPSSGGQPGNGSGGNSGGAHSGSGSAGEPGGPPSLLGRTGEDVEDCQSK